MSKIKFSIITLFPEALAPYLNTSMMLKAQKQNIAEFRLINLRDYGLGPHRSVDDTPYGGGDGMLLRCEPIYAAIEELKNKDPKAQVLLPTPAGQTWTQTQARALLRGMQNDTLGSSLTEGEISPNLFFAEDPELRRGVAALPRNDRAKRGEERELALGLIPSAVTEGSAYGRSERASAKESVRADSARSVTDSPLHFIILCPHYEGYDERILPLIDHQISLGNYILTGGELPALIIVDTLVRLLPGVLGGETSAAIESFADQDSTTIEYPQYTKPAVFRDQKVPEILLSGHHAKIAAWRAEQSRLRTKEHQKLTNQ